MVVARIYLNQLDASAYTTCFGALFQKVTELHPGFKVGETLLGIIADWSDTQVKGLENVLGKQNVSKVMKGCQVSKYQSITPCMHRHNQGTKVANLFL